MISYPTKGEKLILPAGDGASSPVPAFITSGGAYSAPPTPTADQSQRRFWSGMIRLAWDIGTAYQSSPQFRATCERLTRQHHDQERMAA